jgi:5-deoxy-glucuronate isomerase
MAWPFCNNAYEMQCLEVMADPLRKWRFQNDPDHDWIAQRDA